MQTRVVGSFLAGVVLAVALVLVSGAVPIGNADAVEPKTDLTWAGGCLDGDQTSSWTGQVPLPETELVVFNHTFLDDEPVRLVESRLTTTGDGHYVLKLVTEPSGKTAPSRDCTPSAKLDATITVPRGFDSVALNRDGDVVVIVENQPNDTPVFWPFTPRS